MCSLSYSQSVLRYDLIPDILKIQWWSLFSEMICRLLQLANDPIWYHIYPLDAIGSIFSNISIARVYTQIKISRLSAFLNDDFCIIFLVCHFLSLPMGILLAVPSPRPTKMLCKFIADKWLAWDGQRTLRESNSDKHLIDKGERVDRMTKGGDSKRPEGIE
jgi:hypothetical protein